MASPPSFSVVVPTYERPGPLAGCLRALAQLDYPAERYEVVVVDDGGTVPLDDAFDEAFDEAGGSVRLTRCRQANAGPAAARNTGAQQASGTCLAFIDDDCRPAPGWLRELAAQLAETPRALVGGRTVNALPGNLFSTASQEIVSYMYARLRDGSGGARFMASNNLALSAEAFGELGGFDTSFPQAAGEDRDFCARWRARGGAIVYAPDAVVEHAHRLGPASFLRQHFNYGRGGYRFHRAERARSGRSGGNADEGGSSVAPPEPLSYYLGLLAAPFERFPPGRALAVALLIAGAQGATAAGLFAEAWLQSSRSASAPGGGA